ncbi:MAG: LON peptidase substrate-binding domain-containing protein, partial [Phycisphaerae bacterium]|nr:LON peptidase substrate-binding domain-containing protein [Phycisphaerae bacterium]
MAAATSGKPKIISDDETEVIIRPGEQEDVSNGGALSRITVPKEIAVLPVRNAVLFPGTVVPLAIGREKSRRLLNEVLPKQKIIVIVCQKSAEVDDPTFDDLYTVGTATMVLKLLKMDEGNQSIIVHGLLRVGIKQWLASEPYIRARIEVLEELLQQNKETEALMMNARNLARKVIQLSP